jgi:kumamolisin
MLRARLLLLTLAAVACASMIPFAGARIVPSRAALQHTRPIEPAPPSADLFSTLLANSQDLGPVSPSQPLSLVLVLPDPTAARQGADLAAISSPHSRRFGRFLRPAMLAASYGPSPGTVARIRTVLARSRLAVEWQRGNDWLNVLGSAQHMAAAFGVQPRWYRSPGGSRFYASAKDPTLPRALRGAVRQAGHLSSYFAPNRHAIPAGGLGPTNLLAAYDISPLRRLGLDGAGQTVAFLEFDGFKQSDFDTFTHKYGLPPLHPIIKAGPHLQPMVEAEMDLEVVHEIAPRARLLLYNFDQGAHPDADRALLDLQNQIVTENPGAVISESWGWCDQAYGSALNDAYKNVYDHADTLGDSVFVSTGDSGAFTCLEAASRGTAPSSQYLGASLPAAAPGVTAVGGTQIGVATDGSWYDETVWEDPVETGGTGGGVSAYYSMPSWQQGPGVNNTQYNPNNMRSIPDVSADADPASGAAIFVSTPSGSEWTQGGGTSQSAPIWAGITALINQYLQQKGLHRVGFINPALYHIADSNAPYLAFHDITEGTNLYYPATPGYDIASGLGTPDAWNLARDLEAYQRGGGI